VVNTDTQYWFPQESDLPFQCSNPSRQEQCPESSRLQPASTSCNGCQEYPNGRQANRYQWHRLVRFLLVLSVHHWCSRVDLVNHQPAGEDQLELLDQHEDHQEHCCNPINHKQYDLQPYQPPAQPLLLLLLLILILLINLLITKTVKTVKNNTHDTVCS